MSKKAAQQAFVEKLKSDEAVRAGATAVGVLAPRMTPSVSPPEHSMPETQGLPGAGSLTAAQRGRNARPHTQVCRRRCR